VLLAVVFALAAALANAVNLMTQHKASISAPTRVKGWRLALYLPRQPLWLLGVAAAIGSFVFQALALHNGPMSVVQPVLVTELVFVLVLRRVWIRQDVAAAAWGSVLVVCQLGLEAALIDVGLPDSVRVAHFNDISGQNAWHDVALVIVIGRTEPSPRTVERTARALFGADVQEIEADARGAVRYPQTTRGIRVRDGRGIAVEGPYHPDPRVEAVRWAICEAGLVQAIGRGRGVNRTAGNPLQVDILTNVVVPIEVDEVTTWDRIQPGAAQVMRAAGAVPLGYADMAAAYPDLFPSADAARMTLTREAKNPEQTPI